MADTGFCGQTQPHEPHRWFPAMSSRAELYRYCSGMSAAEPQAGVMHPIDKAFYVLAVRGRDYERLRADRLAAEVAQLRLAVAGHSDLEELAKRFHETYERLAPTYRYITRRESAVPWEDVPAANKELMVATVREVFGGTAQDTPEDQR